MSVDGYHSTLESALEPGMLALAAVLLGGEAAGILVGLEYHYAPCVAPIV